MAGKLRAKRKDCAPLAGKSTLNRLEHAPLLPSRYHKIGHGGGAIEGLFVELFLEAYKTPTKEIILDLDATDDPLHGHQEGRFFHGDCDCYCYLLSAAVHVLRAAPARGPSSGARTSMRPPARSTRSNASWPSVGRG
jgi:hypothetical protein